jgi:hypothetical protein
MAGVDYPIPQLSQLVLRVLAFSVVAVGYVTGNDFASRLERAVAASEKAKLIEGRVIDEARD